MCFLGVRRHRRWYFSSVLDGHAAEIGVEVIWHELELTLDARSARDSKPLEVIGTYDPVPKRPTNLYQENADARPYKDIALDRARAKYWLGVGAQPSDPVWKLLSMVRDFGFARKFRLRWWMAMRLCDLPGVSRVFIAQWAERLDVHRIYLLTCFPLGRSR